MQTIKRINTLNNIKISAVFFDLDDTLLDGRSTAIAFCRSLVEHYREFLNIKNEETFLKELLDTKNTLYKQREKLFVKLYTQMPWKRQPEWTDFYLFWSQEYVLHCVAAEGLIETLGCIASHGVKLAVITNGPTAFQKAKIKALGIKNFFDAIIISEEAGIKKPDTGIFKLALEKVGVSKENAVFVGDNPVNDILGAKNSGIKSVWMTNGDTWQEEFRPDFSIDKLSQLEQILKESEKWR